MAINKVVYNGGTLIDLTGDTVTADKLMQGYTAHDKSGEIIIGTATQGGSVTQDQEGYIVLPPNGGGGGGSSDFTTAEVTINTTVNGEPTEMGGYEFTTMIIDGEDPYTCLYAQPDKVFNIMLYRGSATYFDFQAFRNGTLYIIDYETMPICTGDIELNENGLIISGNGSITFGMIPD